MTTADATGNEDLRLAVSIEGSFSDQEGNDGYLFRLAWRTLLTGVANIISSVY